MTGAKLFRGRNHRAMISTFFEEHGAQTFYTSGLIKPNSYFGFRAVESAGLRLPSWIGIWNDRVFQFTELDTRVRSLNLAKRSTSRSFIKAMRHSVGSQ